MSDLAKEGQGHRNPEWLPGTWGVRAACGESRAEVSEEPALGLAPSIGPTSPAERGPLSFHPRHPPTPHPGLREGQRTYKKHPTTTTAKYQLDPQKNTV